MCCARVLHLPDIFIINNGKYNPVFFLYVTVLVTSTAWKLRKQTQCRTSQNDASLYRNDYLHVLHRVSHCRNKGFEQRNKKRRISELLFTYNETKRPAIKHCQVVHVIYFKSSVKPWLLCVRKGKKQGLYFIKVVKMLYMQYPNSLYISTHAKQNKLWVSTLKLK